MPSGRPQLLSASFQPAPPRLSPPALDLSPPAPAQLSHRAQDPETRRGGPVIELIAGEPRAIRGRHLGKAPKCYIATAELESSAVSDTEETPKEVIIPYAVRRNRSARPRQRVATDATDDTVKAQSEPKPETEQSGDADESDELATTEPLAPPVWDGNRHCNLKRPGRCMMYQVPYSIYCMAHACQAVLEDGLKCGNLVVNPTRTRFCRKGYHKETSNMDVLDELKENRLKQNVLDQEQRLSDLQEGRDWVIAHHPELVNVPSLVSINSTSQPIWCPSTSTNRSSGSSTSSARGRGVFDCYSPDDWVGGMWYMKNAAAQKRPQIIHTHTSTTVIPIC